MDYLLIDDERIILDGMEDTLRSVVGDDAVIYKASDPVAAIDLMKKNHVDIVFSDVDMPGMNGLKLAGELKDINPEADIIFATGYAHYSLDAWKTTAKAFILKPVSEEDLRTVLDRVMANRAKAAAGDSGKSSKKLKAICFGNFEIFYEDKPIHFARKKSKEMVAYLIDRKGATIHTGEIRSALWEEEADTEEKKGYIRVLANDIRKSFEDLGIYDFLKNDMDCYSVDVSSLDCDYLNFLDGDEKAIRAFNEEYMCQYPWAENTLGFLLDK